MNVNELRKRRPGQHHKPLRDLDETASDLGYRNRYCLVQAMTHSPVKPPAPELRHRGVSCHTWYDPAKMRAWHRAHLEAKSQQLVAA